MIWSKKEKSTGESSWGLGDDTVSTDRLREQLASLTPGLTLDFPRLVIETLEPLPKERKCFRMVNGVLVERTISDVLPALKTNSDGLKQVLEEMLKQYKSKQTELDEWKVGLTSTVKMVLRKDVMLTCWLYRKRTTFRSCSHRRYNTFFLL